MCADGRSIRNMTLISCRSTREMAFLRTPQRRIQAAYPIILTAVIRLMADTTAADTEVTRLATVKVGTVVPTAAEEMEVGMAGVGGGGAGGGCPAEAPGAAENEP